MTGRTVDRFHGRVAAWPGWAWPGPADRRFEGRAGARSVTVERRVLRR